MHYALCDGSQQSRMCHHKCSHICDSTNFVKWKNTNMVCFVAMCPNMTFCAVSSLNYTMIEDVFHTQQLNMATILKPEMTPSTIAYIVGY
jgi:hypothetical protein